MEFTVEADEAREVETGSYGVVVARERICEECLVDEAQHEAIAPAAFLGEVMELPLTRSQRFEAVLEGVGFEPKGCVDLSCNQEVER